MVSKGCREKVDVRVHREGHIQARQLKVWVPVHVYRKAIATGQYRSVGLEKEIEQYLDVDISGELRFRVTETKGEMVRIQIDSDWVQPTRA